MHHNVESDMVTEDQTLWGSHGLVLLEMTSLLHGNMSRRSQRVSCSPLRPINVVYGFHVVLKNQASE